MNRRGFIGSTLGIAGALLLPWKPKTPVQSIVPVASPIPVQPIAPTPIAYVCYETWQTQKLYNRAGSLVEVVKYGHVKDPHVIDSLTMTCTRCGMTEMQILSRL